MSTFCGVCGIRATSERAPHVWPDDRIEWAKIEQVVALRRFDILIRRRDLPSIQVIYDLQVYNEYAIMRTSGS